ncbi:MAG: heterodisulfide reductase-related iron-sulfur binding cluster [Tepidisphaeraceae bacterium]
MSTALPVIPEIHSTQPKPASPAIELDLRTFARGLSCVHCGLCLPACPTYTETGNEADSPRGRIQLMLGLADGRLQLSESTTKHLDLCLDCRACETACPSGVVYHELIEETRAKIDHQQTHGTKSKFLRWVFFNIFTQPTRLKLALLPARISQKLGIYGLVRKTGLFKLLPGELRKMEQMLPPKGRLWPKAPKEVNPSPNAKKRVAFLTGCVGSVMFDEVNRKAIELLVACGAEVMVPKAQACCGAIHHHNAAHDEAARLAKQNIDAMLPDNGPAVDYVVTTIAGCGAMLREFDVQLRDDPAYAAKAKVFASKVRDIAEVLVELGLPMNLKPVETTVTYHDACHLAHAQRVTNAPRELLAKVPGVKFVALPESDMCCGAAGTYNLTQPEMATRLAERKLKHIASTGAGTCATGNVGCAMHIESEAIARGMPLKVVHPVEILHAAVYGAGH